MTLWPCIICLNYTNECLGCQGCLRFICDNCVIVDDGIFNTEHHLCSEKCKLNIRKYFADIHNNNSELNMIIKNESISYMDRGYFNFVNELQILSNFSNYSEQKRKRKNFVSLWLRQYLIKDIVNIIISYYNILGLF